MDDVFDLGLLLLICAIGKDLQFLSIKSNEPENERNNLLKNGAINNSKKCCFLHTIIRNNKDQPNEYLNSEDCLIINKIITSRFS